MDDVPRRGGQQALAALREVQVPGAHRFDARRAGFEVGEQHGVRTRQGVAQRAAALGVRYAVPTLRHELADLDVRGGHDGHLAARADGVCETDARQGQAGRRTEGHLAVDLDAQLPHPRRVIAHGQGRPVLAALEAGDAVATHGVHADPGIGLEDQLRDFAPQHGGFGHDLAANEAVPEAVHVHGAQVDERRTIARLLRGAEGDAKPAIPRGAGLDLAATWRRDRNRERGAGADDEAFDTAGQSHAQGHRRGGRHADVEETPRITLGRRRRGAHADEAIPRTDETQPGCAGEFLVRTDLRLGHDIDRLEGDALRGKVECPRTVGQDARDVLEFDLRRVGGAQVHDAAGTDERAIRRRVTRSRVDPRLRLLQELPVLAIAKDHAATLAAEQHIDLVHGHVDEFVRGRQIVGLHGPAQVEERDHEGKEQGGAGADHASPPSEEVSGAGLGVGVEVGDGVGGVADDAAGGWPTDAPRWNTAPIRNTPPASNTP